MATGNNPRIGVDARKDDINLTSADASYSHLERQIGAPAVRVNRLW